MSCPEIREQLNEYLDGELAPEAQDQIDRHLGQCLACRAELESLRSLKARAGELDSEIQPGRDLWPGIETRIEASRAQTPPWWLQLVAAGIALAVLSVPLSVWWMGRQDGELTTTAQIEVEADFVATQAELARSEDGVLLARKDLVTAIERHRDVVEEDSLRIWEDNMLILDQAIGELRVALNEDPQNLRLRMLLAARYQQERRLLQKVSRV